MTRYSNTVSLYALAACRVFHSLLDIEEFSIQELEEIPDDLDIYFSEGFILKK